MANTSPAISAAASSCMAGMAWEWVSRVIETVGAVGRRAHSQGAILESVKQVAQRLGVGVERRPAPVGQRHRGARPDAVAGLHRGDVTRLLELAQVIDQ